MQLNLGSGYEDIKSPGHLVRMIMESGELDASPAYSEPEDGETPIGICNTEEMAILTAQNLLSKAADALNSQMEARGSETENDAMTMRLFSKWAESLHTMLWASVETRFAEVLPFDNPRVRIRAGYKVVTLAPEPDFGATILRMILSGALGASELGAGEYEHNCEECPAYDLCDLPVKRPRAADIN